MNRILMLLIINTLVACSVGDEYKSNDFIPQTEIKETLKIGNTDKTITHNWFEIFNDKDLNTLLIYAINSNFSIKQGIERLKQSRLQYMIKSKSYYPMINSQNNYSFSKSNNISNTYSNTNDFRVGFDFSWEIDVWGKGKHISEQYYQLLKNAQYSIANIKVMIISEIILNYIELRSTQEKLSIANKNLSLQNAILDTIKGKYNSGIETELALSHANFVTEKTKQLIPEYKSQIEQSKNAIATLLGVLPQKLPINLEKTNNNIVSKTFKYSVKKLHKLPLNIIQTRPDVVIAETNIKKQNAIVNQAITDLYPDINLDMAWGFMNTSGSNLFNTKSQVYSYTPEIYIPIWNWGQLKNNIELQKSIKEEYLLNYNEAVLTAILEIKTAIDTIKHTYTQNKHATNALNQIKNILKLTKNKYENGLIEFSELAKAEQDLLDAQNNLIDSNANIIKNIAAFYKATGGGYNIYEN